MTTCGWCDQPAAGEHNIGTAKHPRLAPMCEAHRARFEAQHEAREQATALRRSAAQDARHDRDEAAARKREQAAELERQVRLG